MFALVIAIVLSGIAPDPVVTPAPALHDLLSSATPFSNGGTPVNDTAEIGVAPVCDYGVPQIGSGLWQNANALTRTFALPSCNDTGFYGPRSLVFGAAGFASPWLIVPAARPLRPNINVTTVPGRLQSGPAFGLRMAEPAMFARPSRPAVAAPARHH